MVCLSWVLVFVPTLASLSANTVSVLAQVLFHAIDSLKALDNLGVHCPGTAARSGEERLGSRSTVVREVVLAVCHQEAHRGLEGCVFLIVFEKVLCGNYYREHNYLKQ